MAEIYVLPGVERPDLVDAPSGSSQLLQRAIDAGVTDAIVVARDRFGELYVAAATPDADRAAGILMRAISVLSSDNIIDIVFSTDPEAS